MMFEEVLISYNSKWGVRMGKLEVLDDRIKIEHSEYSRELLYLDIEAILKKKLRVSFMINDYSMINGGIKVKLNDGNFYIFYYSNNGRLKSMKTANRKAKLLLKILQSKLVEFRNII